MRMKGWWIAIGIFFAASSALELVSPGAHSELLWHRLPGFDFAYGLIGCALIVVFSKRLGKLFLQRPEGYYEDEESR
jgi:hypothetical protein